ncbi:hypothetical protein BPORC_1911 [Bifidobacterium porcinum]|nr:hypothetical protein BPORC_1911 [Bifidobacterium porcinum]
MRPNLARPDGHHCAVSAVARHPADDGARQDHGRGNGIDNRPKTNRGGCPQQRADNRPGEDTPGSYKSSRENSRKNCREGSR